MFGVSGVGGSKSSSFQDPPRNNTSPLSLPGPSGTSPSPPEDPPLLGRPQAQLRVELHARWKLFSRHMAMTDTQVDHFIELVKTTESERSMQMLYNAGLLDNLRIVSRVKDEIGEVDLIMSRYEAEEILERDPDLTSSIIKACRGIDLRPYSERDRCERVSAFYIHVEEASGPRAGDSGLAAEVKAGSGGYLSLHFGPTGEKLGVRFTNATPMLQDARSDAALKDWVETGTYSPKRYNPTVYESSSNFFERAVYELIRGTDVRWMIPDMKKRHDASEYANRMAISKARRARAEQDEATRSPTERSARNRSELFGSNRTTTQAERARESLDWLL